MSTTKTPAIKTKLIQKCRCCTKPSSKFLELDSPSKNCGTDKTYRDVLYEITNIKVSQTQEKSLTQKVCLKCSSQLNSCYRFIIQAREVFEQYLSTLKDLPTEDDTKDFEKIPEPLIEVPIDLITVEKNLLQNKNDIIAANVSFLATAEIKTEPISLECTTNTEELMNIDNLQVFEIKEEQPEVVEVNTTLKSNDKDIAKDPIYKEERERFDNFNTDSEIDDKDVEDPISEDDFNKDLSKTPVAISCDICHKIYKDKVALRTHKNYSHMPDEKKRPCPLCTHKSSRLSNLKVHIGMVHGADKVKELFKPTEAEDLQFSCPICQKSFRRKDTLQIHIKRIHQNPKPRGPRPKEKVKEERVLCSYCGGSFRTKYGLAKHVVIHTGERPFPCDICKKTFKRPVDLHIHRVIHSDEKPYQCLQCGKAFKRSDKLNVHMRVHSDLRPYKCTECEKSFKYPNVLSTHMLLHTKHKIGLKAEPERNHF